MLSNTSSCTWVLLGLLSFFVFGCNRSEQKDFKVLADGSQFRLLALGEGERTPISGDFVAYTATCYTMDGNLLEESSPFMVRHTIGKSLIWRGLESSLLQLRSGDSALVVLPSDQLFLSAILSDIPPSINDSSKIQVAVRVLEVLSPEEQRKKLIGEIEKIDNLKETEQIEMVNFLEENTATGQFVEGIYLVHDSEGTGLLPMDGDQVVVHYKEMNSKGELFFSSYDAGVPFVFQLGDPDQLLAGFELGIRNMREGGKATWIVPQHLAYGKQGSSSGHVPGESTIIYEAKLVDVIRN